MARIWTEASDPTRHVDYMSDWSVGGHRMRSPRDNLLRPQVLIVEVCGFRFEFHSRAQLEEAMQFFSQAIQPSSMQPDVTLEHHWHPWSQRLPKGLTAASKRLRILVALQRALASKTIGRAFP